MCSHGPIDRPNPNPNFLASHNSTLSQTGTLGGSARTHGSTIQTSRPSVSSPPPPQQPPPQPLPNVGTQTVRSIATTTAALSRAVGGIQRVMRKVMTSPSNNLRMPAQAAMAMQALSPASPLAPTLSNRPIQVGGGSFSNPLRETTTGATQSGTIGGGKASPSGLAVNKMGTITGTNASPWNSVSGVVGMDEGMKVSSGGGVLPSPSPRTTTTTASPTTNTHAGSVERTSIRTGTGVIVPPLPSNHTTTTASPPTNTHAGSVERTSIRAGTGVIVPPLPSPRTAAAVNNAAATECSPRPSSSSNNSPRQAKETINNKAPRGKEGQSEGMRRGSSHFASFVAEGVGEEAGGAPPPIHIVYRTHSGLSPFSQSPRPARRPLIAEPPERPPASLEEDQALADLIDEEVEEEGEGEMGGTDRAGMRG